MWGKDVLQYRSTKINPCPSKTDAWRMTTRSLLLAKDYAYRGGRILVPFLLPQADCLDAELTKTSFPIHVEDPANPSGNDLTNVMSAAWPAVRAAATDTLNTIRLSGWEAVFGQVAAAKSFTVSEKAQRAAASVSTPNRPWCPEG